MSIIILMGKKKTKGIVWCLQHERIKQNQEKKRKPSGLLQPNLDRPSSGPRRPPRENSVDLIRSDHVSQTVNNDNQFGEFGVSLDLLFL